MFIERQWALIVADYRREYQLSAEGLMDLSLAEFQWLLKGLSKHSRFQRAWADAPKHVHDPSERAAIIAAARR